jgi:two-component system, sensor histidine kinase and response regulator
MSRPSPRVLVVDDEAVNRSLLRSILRVEYEIVEAESGVGALEQLTRREFDLVLLDVMMPGMSGYDACRRIKEQTGGVFLPVVLLTALDAQEDRNEGLAAGADDFLSKPFDRRELELRCRALVRLRRHELLIRQQIDELAELQALKDDLVSLVVHDVRNPLAGLMGSLGVIRDAVRRLQGSDGLEEDISTAHDSAIRIRDLLEDVLQVRTLEEKKVPLQLELGRLSEIAAEAIDNLSGDARLREVSVALHPSGDPAIRLDRRLVRRSVENLLANALKYSKAKDAVDVTVSLVPGWVQLEVADHGPGIPDSAKRIVFEKFGSVDALEARSRRGYGLGLYLVNLAVAAHQGRVAVNDRPEGGAAFRVLLPTGTT